MTRLFASIAFSCAVFALVACGDKKPPPKPRAYLALLGKKSEAAITHFEATCAGQLYRSELLLACSLPNDVSYEIVFDNERERIKSLTIDGTLLEARPIFDQAFAPILPDETREIVRNSLLEPQRAVVFRKSGGEVSMFIDVKRALEGDSGRITWHIQDLDIEFPPVP